MNLTLDQIEDLKARLAAGERITRLAREVGVPWQKLWGILKSDSLSATVTAPPPAATSAEAAAAPHVHQPRRP